MPSGEVLYCNIHPCKEIGQAFGLHCATVSRVVRAVEIESGEG